MGGIAGGAISSVGFGLVGAMAYILPGHLFYLTTKIPVLIKMRVDYLAEF